MNKLILRASVAAAALAIAGMATAQTDPSKVVAPSGEASTMVNGKPNPAKKADSGMSRDAAKADAKMQANPTVKGASMTPKAAGEATTSGPNGQPNTADATPGTMTKTERKENRKADLAANAADKKAMARDPKESTPK